MNKLSLNPKKTGFMIIGHPLKTKNLALPEMLKLNNSDIKRVDKKKYFFAVIYRNPSQNQTEFDDFTINFELLLSKMAAENPFCVVITGDFNCRSSQW